MRRNNLEWGGVGGPISPAYAWAMLLTWVIHDAEELRDLRYFQPPAPLPALDDAKLAHLRRAVGVMGMMLLGVTGLGAATGGQHPLFRAANRTNMGHALWHLAASALLRRRTPGVGTAALLVLPTALLTEKALDKAGHQAPPIKVYALFPAAHAAGYVLGRTDDWRRGRNTRQYAKEHGNH